MSGSGDLLGALLEGRYLVQALIARGGMSTVYRGSDVRLDRPVAIKVMDPAYSRDPEFLHRFSLEARAVSRLRHSGLVEVYDQGHDGEHVFLVMELVEGGTLRALLTERGAMPVEVALSVLEPVLAALSTAHRAGLVHRDVKPENVLVADDGTIKVADFGLVRAVAATGSTGSTRSNVILGTVAYLSPEQVTTGSADTRSDVYSAGVLLHELLTGAPPYDGETALAVAYQHVNNDVPAPGELVPGIPPELDDVVLRATRRDPARRYRDAGEMLGALLALRRGLGLGRVRVPTPRTDPATGPVRHGTRLLTSATSRAQPPARADGAPGPAPHRDTLLPEASLHPAHTDAVPTMSAYQRQRRRSRRAGIAWFVVVLLLTTAVGVGAWWLGAGRFTAVPALSGLRADAAQQALTEADLDPVVRTSYDDDAAAQTVLTTQPGSGARVPRGSQVVLTVSLGRPVVPAVAPGTDQLAARRAITDAGLRATTTPGGYDDAVPAGTTLALDPVAGSTVAVGSTVTIALSQGPAPVDVPDVGGSSAADAAATLRAAGLEVGTTTTAFSGSVSGGDVVATSPAAGSLSTRGTTVDLVISSALTVPDVSGQSPEQARTTLTGAGFTPVDGGTTSDTDAAAGTVAATTPAAGALVDPGAAEVRVLVSDAVTVPGVRGSTVTEARTALQALGLEVDVQQLVPLGSSRVVRQDPDAGSSVAPGSTVTVTAFP